MDLKKTWSYNSQLMLLPDLEYCRNSSIDSGDLP